MDEWDGVGEGTLYWIEVYVIGCMRGGGVGDTMYRKKLYDSIGCVGWSGVGVGMIYFSSTSEPHGFVGRGIDSSVPCIIRNSEISLLLKRGPSGKLDLKLCLFSLTSQAF